MKTQHILKHTFLLALSIFAGAAMNGQEQRMAKLSGSTGSDCGGMFCYRKCINYSAQTLVNNSNVFLQGANKSAGAIVDVKSKIGFRVYYSYDGTGHYSSKVSVPKSASSVAIPRKKKKRGCVSCWADGTVYFYDAHDIEYIQDVDNLGTDLENGGNFCISDIDEDIIRVKVGDVDLEYSSHTFYLIAETANGTQISSTYISKSVTRKDFSYKDIFGSKEYYGESNGIYFRILTDFGGTYGVGYKKKVQILSPDSKRMGPFYFFRQMPPIQKIEVERTACGKDVVNMTLDASVISSIGKYHFRAIMSGANENQSNIIKLSKGTPDGNTVPLTIASGSLAGFASSSGTYTFQVFGIEYDDEKPTNDMKGCATTKSAYFKAKPTYLTLTASPTSYTFDGNTYHITQKGANDGECALTVNGGSSRIGSFQYSYNNSSWHTISSSYLETTGSLTRNYTHLRPNKTYYVRVKDSDGCTGSSTRFGPLKEPDDVALNTPTSTRVTCHENNTGSHSDATLKATFSGGIGPYTVKLYNSSGTLLKTKSSISAYSCEFDGYPVGTYTIKVTDRFSVDREKSHTVSSNTELFLSASPSDLSCFEDASGQMELDVSGKETTYATFELTGQTSKYQKNTLATFTGLPAGTYTATVTDTRGCSDTLQNLAIAQPNALDVTASGSKIARYGDNTGTIALQVQDGTAGYAYTLYKGNSELGQGTTEDNMTFTELYNGTYSIAVTDANGCEASATGILVRQPDAPLELDYTQKNVDCFGNETGEIYPVATGGWGHYRYGLNGILKGSSNTIGNLPATGTAADTLFVVDSAGVTEEQAVTLTEPAVLNAEMESIYDLQCFGDSTGAIQLSITGGTETYSVSLDSVNWTMGDSLSNLPAMEDQTVYVLDANGCPGQETVTVSQPEEISIATDTVIEAFCGQSNGGIETTVSGGTTAYTYNWTYMDSLKSLTENSGSLSNIYSGQYKLLLSDAHGCRDSLTVSISDKDGPEIVDFDVERVSCYGASDGQISILEVTGGMPGYAYYLDGTDGGPVFTGLKAGTYLFRVVDQKGCKSGSYYIVRQPDELSISGTAIDPTCHDSYDGLIATKVTGGNSGYVYDWSSGQATEGLQGLNSGEYTLTVTDTKGCLESKTFTVVAPSVPTANLDEVAGVLCTGNTLELDGGNFVKHQWFQDKGLVSTDRYLTVSKSAVYTLQIMDSDGCNGIDTLALEVSDTPLDAVLLVQDSAVIDETVEAIDVTWPVPDSINWLFDLPVTLLDSSSYSQQFASSLQGVVNVTLRAWYGGCYSDSTKTVTVYNSDGEIETKSALAEPLIMGFRAYPNPNSGNFSVGVELSREADIVLNLYNVSSGSIIDRQEQYGLDSYEVPFNLTGLKPGVYVIILIAEQEQQKLKVVVE